MNTYLKFLPFPQLFTFILYNILCKNVKPRGDGEAGLFILMGKGRGHLPGASETCHIGSQLISFILWQALHRI